MTLKQLQYFVSIVQNQSFKKAADELFVSPPALTQQIHSLEKELGCTLLIRSAQSFQITEAGKCFYEGSLSILNQLDTTITRTKYLGGTPAQTLIIGYISTPMDILIRHATKAFHADYPNINIELYPCEFNEIPYLLENRTIDISYITQNYVGHNDSLVYLPSCAYTYDLAIPVTHPFSSKENLSLSDLLDTPLICLNPKHNTALFNNYIEKYLNNHKKLYADSMAELYLMMRQENGVSILPSYLYQTRPDIKAIPLHPTLSDNLGIAYLKDNLQENITLAVPYLLQASSSKQLLNLSTKNLL